MTIKCMIRLKCDHPNLSYNKTHHLEGEDKVSIVFDFIKNKRPNSGDLFKEITGKTEAMDSHILALDLDVLLFNLLNDLFENIKDKSDESLYREMRNFHNHHIGVSIEFL